MISESQTLGLQVGQIGMRQDGQNPTVLVELTFPTQADATRAYYEMISLRRGAGLRLEIEVDEDLLPAGLQVIGREIPTQWAKR